MKKGTLVVCSLMLFILASPGISPAQQKGLIELSSVSEVEIASVGSGGKKQITRVDASKTKVVPGTVVIFTSTYRNVGAQTAENVVVTNPVPANTVYVDGSGAGGDTRIEFSVDGGKSYAAPAMLSVKDAQGKTRKAAAADYTHIRWTVTKPVPPGSRGTVSFKARIK